VTPENAKSWVTKTVRQQIPGARACSNKTPMAIAIQSIPQNDHLPLTGGPQMLMTDNVGYLCNNHVSSGSL